MRDSETLANEVEMLLTCRQFKRKVHLVLNMCDWFSMQYCPGLWKYVDLFVNASTSVQLCS